jgi:hypothetical protein
MWKAFIMKAGQLSLELIALKNAINEIERDITILEEQRQPTFTSQSWTALANQTDQYDAVVKEEGK